MSWEWQWGWGGWPGWGSGSFEPPRRPTVEHSKVLRVDRRSRLNTVEVLVVFTGWTTTERVYEELGYPDLTVEDDRYLAQTVDAANRAVAYWRPDLKVPWFQRTRGPFSVDFSKHFLGGADQVWDRDPMIVRGTTMLASRWFQRKGGVDYAAFAEFGGPPPSVDKDIEQLLRINRAARPVIA